MVRIQYTPREVAGRPSTARVQKRYNEYLNSEFYIDSERVRLYTEYMKEHWNEPLYIRQGGALKYVLSHLTPVILDGELIVGRMSRYIRGAHLYPEYEARWMREELAGIKRAEQVYMEGQLPAELAQASLGIAKLTAEDKQEIEKALEFWKEDWRSVSERLLKEREDYELVERWQQELVFSRLWWDVPDGRTMVNYGNVIEEGLQPVIERCHQKISRLKGRNKEEVDKFDFYQGTILALEGAIAFAESYAREAERLAENADAKRRQELLEIARICRKVPRQRADTFREAVQSFWFIHCIVFIETNGRGMSPGRFDQYMYRPFKDDIETGRMTEAEALELLELLRVKHTELVRAHPRFTEAYLQAGATFQHVTLGGVDKYGRGADNELSRLILQAGINVKTPQPTLSIRWSDNISKDLKLKAVECIKAGSGYPAIFNERVGFERMAKVIGASIEEARDWTPHACIEPTLPGKRMPEFCIPNWNAAKLLELVLNDGINPVTGSKLAETGIKIEEAPFEELKEAWKQVMGLVVKKSIEYWNIAISVRNKIGITLPFTSALYDDCIERGLHCYEGGCRYNDGGFIVSCGVIDVANSLAAMKKCIFEDKLFTMKELREALKHNFEGYEEMRSHLLNSPKFGNADNYVDEIAAELYNAYIEKTGENLNWLGEPWVASTLSVSVHLVFGNACGARPDGRKAGEHLADASLSPAVGTDISGPTAVIRSATHLDAVKMGAYQLNMKFHPTAIEGRVGSEKFIAFNDTWCDLGGYHIQYNIVDANMLRDAQEHPENYQDLMIRVAGFTARWVELGPAVQDEIIRRTEYQEV